MSIQSLKKLVEDLNSEDFSDLSCSDEVCLRGDTEENPIRGMVIWVGANECVVLMSDKTTLKKVSRKQITDMTDSGFLDEEEFSDDEKEELLKKNLDQAKKMLVEE